MEMTDEKRSLRDGGSGRNGDRQPDRSSPEDAGRLIQRLYEASFLKAEVPVPSELTGGDPVSSEESLAGLRECLSANGWHSLLQALRCHNRQGGIPPWELTRPADFLASLEMALDQLNVPARRSTAKAQDESAASNSALYAARTRAALEPGLAFDKVDRLRDTLSNQLQVFCQEQGIPVPALYSREEAYCLQLLATYFASLAQAEGMIAKRGSALARRQIALEGMRAEASLNGRLLPPLLGDLWEIDPLREGIHWERIRHRTAMMLGGVVAAFAGGLTGVVESASDVIVAGVARYAPVAAPVLLVALVTLAAQTITGGVPLSLDHLAQYTARAVWNASIALGAALVAYGTWQYLRMGQEKRSTMAGRRPNGRDERDGGAKT